MKKSSFGRRSSAAGRNTLSGSTFGRQNSFDDMRFLLIVLIISQFVYNLHFCNELVQLQKRYTLLKI